TEPGQLPLTARRFSNAAPASLDEGCRAALVFLAWRKGRRALLCVCLGASPRASARWRSPQSVVDRGRLCALGARVVASLRPSPPATHACSPQPHLRGTATYAATSVG